MFTRKVPNPPAPPAASTTRKALYSRSVNVNPLGKSTAEVRVMVPEELQQALQALAVLRNTNLSDYVRDVLMEHAYGKLGMARLKVDGKNMEG
jgi:hypothetical protein